MANIHPTAVIGKNVKIGEGVIIHPYSVIEGNITIGDGCIIGPAACITGWVTIGKNTRIHSYAVIGDLPQDYSYNGEPGLVEIGDNCMIREGVTINLPVHGDKGEKTHIGNSVFMMANSHVGHNGFVGDFSVLANGALLAGYVKVEEYVFISGNCAVHQFCRVGGYSMVGGVSKVVQDIPVFSMSDGQPAVFRTINAVGLKRRGIGQEVRSRIKEAYSILYDTTRTRTESLKILESQFVEDPYVSRIVEFVRGSKRGIVGCHFGDVNE